MSIRVMLIAMGMMTGIAGAPPAAVAIKETAATQGSRFDRFSDFVSSQASTAKEAVNNKMNQGKKDSFGQNTVHFVEEAVVTKIMLQDMLIVLKSGDLHKALAYAERVNGAMMLVIACFVHYSNSTEQKENDLAQQESNSAQAVYVQLTNQIEELRLYEAGDAQNVSKAADWKKKVEELINLLNDQIRQLDEYRIKAIKAPDIIPSPELTSFIYALKNLVAALRKAISNLSTMTNLAGVSGLNKDTVCFQKLSTESVEHINKIYTTDYSTSKSKANDKMIMKIILCAILPARDTAFMYLESALTDYASKASTSATQSGSGDKDLIPDHPEHQTLRPNA